MTISVLAFMATREIILEKKHQWVSWKGKKKAKSSFGKEFGLSVAVSLLIRLPAWY